jgi:hypothetical protein
MMMAVRAGDKRENMCAFSQALREVMSAHFGHDVVQSGTNSKIRRIKETLDCISYKHNAQPMGLCS